MSNVLITGASRGIGLALTKIYLQKGDTVYAVCRQASAELLRLKTVNLIEGVDVIVDEDLFHLKTLLSGIELDIIINNAGIKTDEFLHTLNFADIEQQFRVNALGPLKVTQTLMDNLTPGSKVALISTRMGSISDNSSGGYYGYRMSKTALNSLGKTLAQDLKPKNISVALLHPGFVKTDMVNLEGEVTPEHAAKGLTQRIEELTMSNTGSFWHANGEQLPW